MDPLTHALVGGVLADTGLARHTRLATTTLLIGSVLPDVDGVTQLGGMDAGLYFRRGWTHGVLAMVVLPLVLTLAVIAWDRWRRPDGVGKGPPLRPGQLFLLAAIAVVSHNLFDWFNTYGTRFLMPFDGTWFYGDALFIVDPWLWLLLGGVVFLNHSAGRRNLVRWSALAVVPTLAVMVGAGPHGWARWLWLTGLAALALLRRRRLAGDGRRRARWALAAAGVYALGMLAGTTAAAREIRAGLAAAGVSEVECLMVGPVAVDPVAREAVIATPGAYRFASHHWLRRPRFRLAEQTIATPPPDKIVRAALQAPCVRGMVSWMRFPFFEVEKTAVGYDVFLLDARYIRRRTRGFGGAFVALDPGLVPRCPDLHP